MGFLSVPFGYILKWCYMLVQNYGVAIILFTILSKLIILPFQMKSKKSMMEMARIQPKIKELEKRYKDDKQKYSMEVSKLYKKEGVSMFGGCLPMLITLPIMIGLYSVVRQPLTYIFGVGGEQLKEMAQILMNNGIGVKDLEPLMDKGGYMLEMKIASFFNEHGHLFAGIKDGLADLKFNFLGLDLSATPNFKYPSWLWAIPILSGVTSWLSGWIMRKGQVQTEQTQQANGMMNFLMPAMSIYIAFVVPAGLGLYWIISNILSIIQEPLLTAYYTKKAAKKALEGENK